MPDRSRKRPRDPNQLGKLIVDLATRAAKMTPEERSSAAKKAAEARWRNEKT